MAVRVLVVDDSGFFRRRVTEMLNADPTLEVIGSAANGKEAIEQVSKLRPDVVTMDIEMPIMDGITATREIMRSQPTPIIMFSSLTTDGAKATLDALDAGALDFLPKRFEDISSDREEARKLLCERVRQLGRRPLAPAAKPASPAVKPTLSTTPPLAGKPAASPIRARGDIKLVAIGTSTGGPVALQEVLSKIPGTFSVPIILVQHMPGSFTPAFAQRLNTLCAITVKEAADGDVLKPATAYLAPGGKQMTIDRKGEQAVIRVTEALPNQTYKPCVDITFQSVAKLYPKNTLAIILTGMGADGREGCRELKQGGSVIWAQDQASCVVYGMPAAVTDAGLSERSIPLKDIGISIAQRV
ncbi:MAG: chemotaxis-specific protein-glutamate methyltransferase CheB [Gammaproteobacteria bacterium]|nr:chemotaxis-specific protein-glutamate methyltransferase CheB [Gammaproteobacteria bacterium]